MQLFDFFKKKTPAHRVPLLLSDSLTREKRPFKAHDDSLVSMYSCGPTVYDHAHIGNLRAYLLPDILKRVLIYNGYNVRHVINFTDFGHLTDDGDEGEDKMMKALKRENLPISLTSMKEVARRYMESFKADMESFRNLPPDEYTPASEYVKEQIALITTLMEKGYAYTTRDGVYFDIEKFPHYGVLGNVCAADHRHGARVAINTEKRNPSDFALWKRGLLGWDSVWGKGFPGWHIECTAMVMKTLGNQIDIHTGGEDLMYTHHNGEIAQAEAVTGKTYVNYWLHNAHITINDTKIAKSLGNGVRLSQLTDSGYPIPAYRYWLLSGHYRTPMNFTFDALGAAKQALFRLKRFIIEECKNPHDGHINEDYQKRFHEIINNDLDTPGALALVWDIVKDTSLTPADRVATIREIDRVLELGLSDSENDMIRELGIISPESLSPDVQALIDARAIARATHNWDESDRLRDALNLKGYSIEDTPTGPRVSKAR